MSKLLDQIKELFNSNKQEELQNEDVSNKIELNIITDKIDTIKNVIVEIESDIDKIVDEDAKAIVNENLTALIESLDNLTNVATDVEIQEEIEDETEEEMKSDETETEVELEEINTDETEVELEDQKSEKNDESIILKTLKEVATELSEIKKENSELKDELKTIKEEFNKQDGATAIKDSPEKLQKTKSSFAQKMIEKNKRAREIKGI